MPIDLLLKSDLRLIKMNCDNRGEFDRWVRWKLLSARIYKPYLMDMVIEEYNDERIQNIANIHYNLIIGKCVGILTSMDGVWDRVSLLWSPGELACLRYDNTANEFLCIDTISFTEYSAVERFKWWIWWRYTWFWIDFRCTINGNDFNYTLFII